MTPKQEKACKNFKKDYQSGLISLGEALGKSILVLVKLRKTYDLHEINVDEVIKYLHKGGD